MQCCLPATASMHANIFTSTLCKAEPLATQWLALRLMGAHPRAPGHGQPRRAAQVLAQRGHAGHANMHRPIAAEPAEACVHIFGRGARTLPEAAVRCLQLYKAALPLCQHACTMHACQHRL